MAVRTSVATARSVLRLIVDQDASVMLVIALVQRVDEEVVPIPLATTLVEGCSLAAFDLSDIENLSSDVANLFWGRALPDRALLIAGLGQNDLSDSIISLITCSDSEIATRVARDGLAVVAIAETAMDEVNTVQLFHANTW